MINKINICGLNIKVKYVSKEKLNEINKEGIVVQNDSDLCGLADIKKLAIYIDKDMHDFQIRKTLAHEAGHLLLAIKNELIGEIREVSFHEMLAIFISENSKEIASIHKQIYCCK